MPPGLRSYQGPQSSSSSEDVNKNLRAHKDRKRDGSYQKTRKIEKESEKTDQRTGPKTLLWRLVRCIRQVVNGKELIRERPKQASKEVNADNNSTG